MKTVGVIIKEIRLVHNLTQREFAEKFFITEKTVSNYENGKRMPDLPFLSAVCSKLNVTLDYFMEKQQQESKFNDLVVVSKNGKYAIFDTYQSVYLTPHIYDGVRLSESGNHIVYRADDLIDEEGKLLKNQGKINFSAICDNNGKLKTFPNIEFGYNGVFNLYNVCPARVKDDGLVHLVDDNGNILGEGFTRIMPVESKNDIGIYYGLSIKPYDPNSYESRVYDRKLIYKDGSIIDGTFEDINACFGEFKLLELDSIERVEEYILNYGSLMLNFVFDKSIFNYPTNYRRIIKATRKHCEDKKIGYRNLFYATNFLINEAKSKRIDSDEKLTLEERAKFRFYSEEPVNPNTLINEIEKGKLKKNILDLYEMIGIV